MTPQAKPERKQSRNVLAYVKRKRRADAAYVRYSKRHAGCAPLWRALQQARSEALLAYGRLTGGQAAQARRLLGYGGEPALADAPEAPTGERAET